MSTIPSFESHASAIVTALSALDKAAGKSRDAIALAMQAFIDAAYAAGCDKDEETVKALGVEVRTCQTFIDAVASGMIEAKTCTEYAQGAMRAYFHGMPWTPSLKNDPDASLPWSKKPAKKGARPAAGEAESAAEGIPSAAPESAAEGREYVRTIAIQLQRWGNANATKLDLATREAIEQFRALADGLAK